MATKITKKDNFQYVMSLPGVAGDERAMAFLQAELDKLTEKSATRKPTAVQVENEKLNQEILDLLEQNRIYLTSEVIGLNQAWVDARMSTSKMASRLNDLVKAGKLTKSVVKGRSYFQLA